MVAGAVVVLDDVLCVMCVSVCALCVREGQKEGRSRNKLFVRQSSAKTEGSEESGGKRLALQRLWRKALLQ